MSQTSRRGSYITAQLESINGQLQTLFDELGISTQERTDREKRVYAVVSEALAQHVEQVKRERDELKSQCVEMQQNVRDMANALRDVDLNLVLGDLGRLVFAEISPPFVQVEQDLTKVFNTLEKVYIQRSDKVNKLLAQLNSLSDKVDGVTISADLHPPSSKDDLNLSNSYLAQLEAEIQRWRNELQSRISKASMLATQIVSLWVELGTPQEAIDNNIMSCYRTKPEQLGTTLEDIARLNSTYESLSYEKSQREAQLSTLTKDINTLWDKLSEDETYIHDFKRANRGLGPNAINAFMNEHSRLQEKKRQHIHVFIQDAREQLQTLWQRLYFSEEEMSEFMPAYADISTDASLEAHESEILRLEQLLIERQPILSLIEQFYELQNEAKQLEASTQDASRLLGRGGGGKRDPSRLLREEKIRKRLAKRKPIVLQELKQGLAAWENHTATPFLIHGESFNEILEAELDKLGGKRKPLSAMSAPTPKPAVTRGGPPARQQPVPFGSRTPSRINASPSKQASRSVLAKQAMPPPSSMKPPLSPSRGARPMSRMGGPLSQRSSSRSDEERSLSRSRNMETPSRTGFSKPPPVDIRSRSELGQYPALGRPDNRCRSVMGNRSPNFKSGIAQQTEKTKGTNGMPASRITSAPGYSQNYTEPRSATSLGTHRPFSEVPQMAAVSPSIASTPSSRTISTTSTMSSSENWKSLDEATSSDDEFDDPVYTKWRQEAVKRLGDAGGTPQGGALVSTGEGAAGALRRKPRVSEFNWDKDTF